MTLLKYLDLYSIIGHINFTPNLNTSNEKLFIIRFADTKVLLINEYVGNEWIQSFLPIQDLKAGYYSEIDVVKSDIIKILFK